MAKIWVISKQSCEEDEQDKLIRFIAFPTDEVGLKNTIKIAEMWGEKAIVTYEFNLSQNVEVRRERSEAK